MVIPAHNEAAVIGETLRVLLEDAQPGEFDVVVVPNGCTDGTSDVARAFGPAVTVVDVSQPSKPAALNAGDAHARGFPRLYLDADIPLPTSVARALVRALDVAEPRMALPTPRVDLSGCSWPVRAYLTTFERLARDRADAGGSGVYGLNEFARRRFDVFPDLTGDDLFVDQLFSGDERLRLPDLVTVTPPRHLRSLVAVRTRVYAGNLEYAASAGGSGSGHAPGNRAAFLGLARQPSAWPSAAVYLLVTAWAKAAARQRLARGQQRQWLRDDSSRSDRSLGAGSQP